MMTRRRTKWSKIELFELFVLDFGVLIDTYPFFYYYLYIMCLHNGLFSSEPGYQNTHLPILCGVLIQYDFYRLVFRVTQMCFCVCVCLINAESDIYYIDLIYVLFDPLNIVCNAKNVMIDAINDHVIR